MSSAALVAEHATLNSAIDRSGWHRLADEVCEQYAKRRRCRVKTELLARARRDDRVAKAYAVERRWLIRVAA